MPKVNPEILAWARETAGFSREVAVGKLGIKDAHGIKAVDRLSSLETGETEPTRPTLVKMAKQYRRPLVTFYLSAPPRKGDRGVDFRTLSNDPLPTDNALLDALIRDAQARQSMVRSVLEDEEEDERLWFVGVKSVSDGHDAVLDCLKRLLDVSLDQYRAQPDAGSAFDLLRGSAGRAGVFVLLKGDLGSYHTAMDTEIFRGFTIADQVAPFVVINDRDATAAWSFTLLHELVHIVLGQTGVGGFRTDNEIERFCNDVASEFLLPDRDIKALGLRGAWSRETKIEWISEFARNRNLSHTMVSYKGYRIGDIEREDFEELSAYFRQHWYQERDNRRERARRREGGPNYYVVRRHRIGNELIELVRRMMDSGALTTSKAARILGVKLGQVQSLFDVSARP